MGHFCRLALCVHLQEKKKTGKWAKWLCSIVMLDRSNVETDPLAPHCVFPSLPSCGYGLTLQNGLRDRSSLTMPSAQARCSRYQTWVLVTQSSLFTRWSGSLEERAKRATRSWKKRAELDEPVPAVRFVRQHAHNGICNIVLSSFGGANAQCDLRIKKTPGTFYENAD